MLMQVSAILTEFLDDDALHSIPTSLHASTLIAAATQILLLYDNIGSVDSRSVERM